jgi:C4-type Zn-finger protein
MGVKRFGQSKKRGTCSYRTFVYSESQKTDPNVAEQVGKFIGKLQACLDADQPTFTFTLDDPAGNSFIENPYPSLEQKIDHQIIIK